MTKTIGPGELWWRSWSGDLHSKKSEDEDEEEEEKEKGDDGLHAGQQRHHQVPQRGPVPAVQVAVQNQLRHIRYVHIVKRGPVPPLQYQYSFIYCTVQQTCTVTTDRPVNATKVPVQQYRQQYSIIYCKGWNLKRTRSAVQVTIQHHLL